MVKLIVAIGENNLIGTEDKMAWYIPDEFKHFKESTLDSSLLMGQRTFLGLPGKLERRKMYVLGYEPTETADVSITSMEELNELFNKYRNSDQTLWIAGGKSIYEQFYKEADELIISEVKVKTKGNVFLDMDLTNYNKELIKEHEQFDVYKYTKKEAQNG